MAYAVEARHPDVDQGDVGTQLSDLLDRGFAVGGLADHNEVVVRLEHPPDPLSDDLVVVGDQDRESRPTQERVGAVTAARQGLDRVRLHADLTILAKLARTRAVPLAA